MRLIVVGAASDEGGIFHCIDVLQCFVERRKGGETGVKSVQSIRGGVETWKWVERNPWAGRLLAWDRRRIDRISLFRAKPGLRLQPDFTLSDEEMNTFACSWHHNLTAAVCSFRAAKALRSNPGSRHSVTSFRWRDSVPFEWKGRQLLEGGFIEPGQWF